MLAVATVMGAGLAGATPALAAADSAPTNSGEVTVKKLEDGSTVHGAPEGSAAAAESCAKDAVCLYTKKNYGGTKWTVDKKGVPHGCTNLRETVKVRSLITGKDRGISSMRTKKRCHGTPSTSFKKNARVNSYSFTARSVTA